MDLDLDPARRPTFGSTTVIRFTQPRPPVPRPSPTWSAPRSTRSPSTAGPSTPPTCTPTTGSGSTTSQSDNELRVVADCTYSHTGEGLHRFVDPADDRVYLYTQFEVPDARRVFTTFEQPDLKAVFTLHGHRARRTGRSCRTPRRPSPSRPGDGTARVALPDDRADVDVHHRDRRRRVPRRSTTPTSASTARSRWATTAASRWCRTSTPTSSSRSPSRASRSSRTPSTSPTRSTSTTSSTCPSSTTGAMENAGCVTLRDEYLPRSRQARWFYEQRANTVLHEMAHMWFGDLVTMRWWDDLWLNESFAEWASHHAMVAGHDVRRGVDRLHQRPQELGLPPGPAALHAPDRRRQPRPRGRRGQLRRHHLRQGRLGAQAARRLGRRGASSSPGCAPTSQRHAFGNSRVHRPARRARGDLRPRPAARGPRSGCRPPASTRSAADFESTTTAATRSFAVAADRAPGLPDAAPAPDRRRPLRPRRRTAAWSAARRSRPTSSASAPRSPSWSASSQPDLLLLNDGDLTYAKIRFDERSLATVRRVDPPARRLAGPGAVLGRAVGHDPRRRDARRRLRRAGAARARAPRPTRPPSSSCRSTCRSPSTSSRTRASAPPCGRPGRQGLRELLEHAEPGSDHQLTFVRGVRRHHRQAHPAVVVRRRGPQRRGARPARRPCSTATRTLDGPRRRHPTCAGRCSPRWPAPAGPTRPRIAEELAPRQHHLRPGAGGRRPRGAARRREAKAQAWEAAACSDDVSNETQRSIAYVFDCSGQEEVLAPYLEQYLDGRGHDLGGPGHPDRLDDAGVHVPAGADQPGDPRPGRRLARGVAGQPGREALRPGGPRRHRPRARGAGRRRLTAGRTRPTPGAALGGLSGWCAQPCGRGGRARPAAARRG